MMKCVTETNYTPPSNREVGIDFFFFLWKSEVIQSHAFSHIFTWFHTFSHIFTWFHTFSLGFTHFHLGFTRFHLFSHVFTV